MFDQYSYKTKFKALIILFVLLVLMAYQRSVKPFLFAIEEYRNLVSIVEKNNTENVDPIILREEIKQLNRLIGKEEIGKERVQNEIVQFVSSRAPLVSLSKVESIHQFVEDSHTVYTYRLDLSGGVNELLKSLYDFEKDFEYSKVVGARFYTTKHADRKIKLHLSIIFQNYDFKT